MDNSRSLKVDFITELFDRGLHSFLEDIILSLDHKTVMAFQDVSQEWERILFYYLESKNPRLQDRISQRINQAWKTRSPLIHEVDLRKFNISKVSTFHMVGDRTDIVVAANINETKIGKIIVLCPRRMFVKNVLDLTHPDNEEGNIVIQEIKMSMDEHFLVCYIHQVLDSSNNKYFYQIFDRKDNFSPLQLRLECHPDKCKLIGPRLANIPFLRNGKLLILMNKGIDELTKNHNLNYEEIDLSQKTTKMIQVIIL